MTKNLNIEFKGSSRVRQFRIGNCEDRLGASSMRLALRSLIPVLAAAAT